MGYRWSGEKIKKWERLLTWWLVGGITLAFALVGIALVVVGAGEPEEGSIGDLVLRVVAIGGVAIGVITVVGVVFLAAIMGGQAMHPRGWIVGAAFATWFLGGVYPLIFVMGGALGHLIYWGGLVLTGAGYFWIGDKVKAPMWLQAPVPHSPRVYLTHGDEDRPDRG